MKTQTNVSAGDISIYVLIQTDGPPAGGGGDDDSGGSGSGG